MIFEEGSPRTAREKKETEKSRKKEKIKEHMGEDSAAAPASIDSSNIGFKLLKKHGWKEGTGLGVSGQGRLEPVQAYLKKNKRGLGADKVKKTAVGSYENLPSNGKTDKEHLPTRKKRKTVSKRVKKMLEEEKQLQEKEFERAFFREFWPDNV